ncbi:hypothetical protein OIV83_003712 [Microbotryomycetes sp. JL201]|nr:hypothetical protein OIV83_003712 [Microbotryomycetes sp. JL201]
MPGKFDLEEQFSFYGAYHTNKINVLIHVLCVPTILTTALVLVHGLTNQSFGNIRADLPGLHPFVYRLTVPSLYAISTALYYVALEPLAGLLYFPVLVGLSHIADVAYNTDAQQATKYAWILFVASWIAQFVGHGKFEGRAPALLDSLFQSLVLAVFFVWLEVLFFLGYRPTLHRRLQNRISKEVLAYRRGKGDEKRAGRATTA